jgi:very-short-patch-repair endonuclease
MIRDKAIRLYQYLQHLIRLRMSVVLDADKYIDIIWLSEIPHHKLCYCAAWDIAREDDDPVWVEIKRPILPKVPKVPEECLKWVDSKTLENYKGEPVLREKIIQESADTNEESESENYLFLSDFPDVIEIWNKYLDEYWKFWADEYGHAKEVQDIYSRLFSMYQQQKALGESYEVIIGLGLLNYKTEKGVRIYRHFITAQTELVFEPNKGTIVVKASPEGAKLQFETEMLDPSEQPPTEIQLNLEESLKEISNEIWDKSLIHPLIRSWVNSFNSKAIYYDGLIPSSKQELKDYPIVNFAPAIILRKRPNRGALKFIDKIIEQLRNGRDVPPAVKIFLDIYDIQDQKRGASEYIGDETENASKADYPQEIYFPLPTNEDQLRIVQEMGNKKGILVQGPPGTGKSHTIANLISHFLAEGKRILVTSQTARALKVLKDKIPSQIKPLCISVLGNRQEDFDNLRNAVHDITSKYYLWSRENQLNTIKRIEEEIYKLRKKQQTVRVALRELREKEIYKYTIIEGKFKGTAQSIAKKLKETEERYGWIPDEISSGDSIPLEQEEFTRLIDLHRKLNKERCEELLCKRIDSSNIFNPEEFVEIVEKEQKYRKREKQIESNIELKILYGRLKKTDIDKRRKLLNALLQLEKVKKEACRRPLPWLNEAVSLMLGDQDQPLKELNGITKRYLQNLKGKALLADECVVSIPDKMDLVKVKADAEDLLCHFAKGKNLGWSVFRPKIYKRIKYLLTDVLVNGRSCNNSKSLEELINFINVELTLQKLRDAWKDKIGAPSGTRFNQVAVFAEQFEALEVILAIEPTLSLAKEAIKELAIISEPCWHDDSEMEKLTLALDATFVIDQLGEINQKIDKIKISLQSITTNPKAHPINLELLRSLESRDWNLWGEAYNKLIKLEEDQQLLDEYLQLMRRLKEKAPLLVEMFCENPYDEIWDSRAAEFDEAWDWLRADAWLREFEETHDEYQLQRDHNDLEKKIGNTIAKLASEKAWYHCFSNMTEEQRQHLMAWAKAIQRIGKGTGKRAEKHRRDAEMHMEECREAIPGWIMPLYRVAETISPHPEIFDVVIVDEASQSGPDALMLLFIAKKCIIVGDDQQISPEGVGVNRQDVDLLIDRYLKDIPIADSYGLESSLFTHAEIRFGSRIVLKEHFRCVPEIIQFSNDICYSPLGINLVPLRTYPPYRLTPICVRYIQEGYREGSGSFVVNKPEAEALVQQIIKCCKDPRYKGKTMGVISLQGDLQARYIEQLLVNTIGPEEIEKRNLICGNPYDFQGDERDVIFMSLVAATNQRIGPLVKEADKRRFNVAASRAKDQMWLFHSCTINDLSPSDYRYKLLAYCQNPTRIQYEVDEDVFESQFEKDVYEMIVARGYKAIPQFKFAGYRIDIVVEGIKTRLAVECDGDNWHGPDQYEADQIRQRILERAGWRFWRIRGSSFYRDPSGAMEPLWQILEEMEIFSAHTIAKEFLVEPTKGDMEKQRTKVTNELIPERESVKQSMGSPINDRLGSAFEYAQKLAESRPKESRHKELRKVIISLLRQSTQGEDLIADKALRQLGVSCRGRNRIKLRKRVKRVVADLKREGIIEVYETATRRRLKLSNQQMNLFDV